MDSSKCPPVMICGFNRPECLRLVFEAVRKAKPEELFLVLDHPRANRPNDMEGWLECKNIFSGVDWPCNVHFNYADKNMGCGKRMLSGISWTFEHVDRAIILEDDCVPNLSFFRFCGELLEKYKYDDRVGMIAGYAGHFHQSKVNVYGWSYFFDRTCTIWGWATWRRMWIKHDPSLSEWRFFSDTDFVKRNFFQCRRHFEAWKRNIQAIYDGKKNVWAAAWGFTMLKNHCLCIHPVHNMVDNVGSISSRGDNIPDNIIGDTRKNSAKKPSKSYYGRRTYDMEFPLIHPNTYIPLLANEYWYYEDVHKSAWWRKIPTLHLRAWNKFLRICRGRGK